MVGVWPIGPIIILDPIVTMGSINTLDPIISLGQTIDYRIGLNHLIEPDYSSDRTILFDWFEPNMTYMEWNKTTGLT